jgi:hypothetical protein
MLLGTGRSQVIQPQLESRLCMLTKHHETFARVEALHKMFQNNEEEGRPRREAEKGSRDKQNISSRCWRKGGEVEVLGDVHMQGASIDGSLELLRGRHCGHTCFPKRMYGICRQQDPSERRQDECHTCGPPLVHADLSSMSTIFPPP